MKLLIDPRRLILIFVLVGWLGASGLLCADDVPATQPATQPAVADSPAVKEVRNQMLAWDADMAKMSLEEFRKTFHTENEREATYADYLAHDTWEAGKTEQAIRDKWGPDADKQFGRLMGFTTREEDASCDLKVDGDHAVASWPDIKEMKPEKMIRVNGKWYSDVHAMWDDWILENPTMETDKRPLGKLMKQMRMDIAEGKYDDADSCIKDLQTKLTTENGN